MCVCGGGKVLRLALSSAPSRSRIDSAHLSESSPSQPIASNQASTSALLERYDLTPLHICDATCEHIPHSCVTRQMRFTCLRFASTAPSSPACPCTFSYLLRTSPNTHKHTHHRHTEVLKTWEGFGVGDRRGARRVHEEKLTGLQDSRGMTAARPGTHRAQPLVSWSFHFSIVSSLPLLNCCCAPDSGQYTRQFRESGRRE